MSQNDSLAHGAAASPPPRRGRGNAGEVFFAALRLGLTSFGGPIAHLGFYHDEYVERRGWLDERSYADLVALCQFLPGPASSQVGMGVGLIHAGFPGMLAAWLGFTLPSALAMVVFAYGVDTLGRALGSGWLHGLQVVAVAVVAQAVLGMMRTLAPDRKRASLAAVAAIIVLAVPSALSQIVGIILGGVVGTALFKASGGVDHQAQLPLTLGRRMGGTLLVIFFVLLFGLPLLAATMPSQGLKLLDAFYRAGSLVFGGGHVVLPLLQESVVPAGWVSNTVFLAGYGAAQAVPGPLFTFAAYLGAVMNLPPNGWSGALLCLVAIFLPSFFLIAGTLPFWDQLRRLPAAQGALRGVNAAVVGLLLAALYHPVWTSAILSPPDFALAVAGFLLLFMWKLPPWLVVVLSAVGGQLIASL